ncbi:hypothetical protein QH494_28165 [Sphingomonas sp. AR_OL41]|uniref:hypothetical protein n=1 Tax=Sphingomonas sp. AR_OL41 TaxID=3042729 RepID=UPI0024814196|nr:hypothetical protein [Sphingomonas sp. AR_OL41]MDH7976072.1 hypothetical protein [Sphingomonas sp. AR_OL41]
MHVHKVKPVHGWKEFLNEIAIIVVGVLIALGLEQVVSSVEWSRKVAESRDALGLELAENLGKMETRVEVAHCIDQRLDAIAAIVDRASRSGKLPALPTPASPPYYSWGTGVWNSALSAQSASHFPADQLRGYSRYYQILDRIAGSEPQEEAAWTTLYELAGPGRPFDADDARAYRKAIGQARQLNGLISGFGVRGRQAIDGYHLTFDNKVYGERLSLVRARTLDCGSPAGTPPKTYGSAPAANFAEQAQATPPK